MGAIALEAPGDPELHVRARHGEVGGQHAENAPDLAIEHEGLSQDRGVRAESPLPGTVAQDGDGIGADVRGGGVERRASGLLRGEGPSHGGRHRENGEEVLGNLCHAHDLDRLVGLERAPHHVPTADTFEPHAPFPPIYDVARGDAHRVERPLLVGAEDSHQPIGARVGKRFEKDGVDHAENRGIGANSETEHHDDDRREARVLAERSESCSDILAQAGQHGCSSPLYRRSRSTRRAPDALELA